MTPRELLTEVFHAAVAAADPRVLTARAVADLAPTAPTHLIALGKASRRMAEGALDALRAAGTTIAGGLVVTVDGEGAGLEPLQVVVGDHPLPADRSARAAHALGQCVRRVAAGERAIVLLSGGTSSLIAAPIDGIAPASMRALFREVLAAGARIQTMNAIRRRVLAWGGGRLATALSHAEVDLLVVSDVLGDELPAIGSGPCSPDPTTAGEIAELVRQLGIDDTLPRDVEHYLREAIAGRVRETVKPGAPEVERIRARIIANNRTALAGAAVRARELGVREVTVAADPLVSPSAVAGSLVARDLMRRGERGSDSTACRILGGETTVKLDPQRPALGGRCLELALAAAGEFGRDSSAAVGVTLLAAGTDGRDGPTDAAGAIVDSATWGIIEANGRHPERDLVRHESYSALDAASALLRTGPTGTNVNDVVIGLVLGRADEGGD